MPESPQLRDIFHKHNEEMYTLNQWARVHAEFLQRIAVALERLADKHGTPIPMTIESGQDSLVERDG